VAAVEIRATSGVVQDVASPNGRLDLAYDTTRIAELVPVHRYDTYCKPIFSAKLTFETALKVA